MARSRETKIELTAYDDLFQTDESREEAKLSKIREIPISEIDEFPDHPFKVLMDEDMEKLVESIIWLYNIKKYRGKEYFHCHEIRRSKYIRFGRADKCGDFYGFRRYRHFLRNTATKSFL